MAQTWPRAPALVTGSDMACPRVWVVARLNGYGVRKGRKEGPATGRNRGKAGSGVAGRVDTGSGQRKTPQGEPYGASGGLADYQPLPARADSAMRATNRAARRR